MTDDWYEPMEVNGRWYKEDSEHNQSLYIKKTAAEKYPQYDWDIDERFPDLVCTSFGELLCWKMDPNDP